jgi:hypothetical protein
MVARGEIIYRQMACYRHSRYNRHKIIIPRVTLFLTKFVFNNFALTASFQICVAMRLIQNVTTNLRLRSCRGMVFICRHSNKKIAIICETNIWRHVGVHFVCVMRCKAWNVKCKKTYAELNTHMKEMRLLQISDPVFRQPNVIRRATRRSGIQRLIVNKCEADVRPVNRHQK